MLVFSCEIHHKGKQTNTQNHEIQNLKSVEDSICLEETEKTNYIRGNLAWQFAILTACSEDSLIEEGEIFEFRYLKVSKSINGKTEELYYSETAISPYGAHGFPLIDRDQYVYFEEDTLIIADHGGKLTYRWFLWHKFILDNEKWNYVRSDIEQFNPLADSVVYNHKTIVSDKRVYLDSFEAKPVFEYLEE